MLVGLPQRRATKPLRHVRPISAVLPPPMRVPRRLRRTLLRRPKVQHCKGIGPHTTRRAALLRPVEATHPPRPSTSLGRAERSVIAAVVARALREGRRCMVPTPRQRRRFQDMEERDLEARGHRDGGRTLHPHPRLLPGLETSRAAMHRLRTRRAGVSV